MTGEEMERAIEFLLQSQARTEAQLAQTGRQLEEFAQFTRSNLEALNEHTRSLRETVRALTLKQAHTDERLSDLESSGQS
jgi:hypothetical protein